MDVVLQCIMQHEDHARGRKCCLHAMQTLELVHADCEQLLASAQGTAQLADHISSKVSHVQLDAKKPACQH